MAPNKNPCAKVKPGISQVEIKATAVAVSNTKPKAMNVTMRRHFHRAFQEVFCAASKSIGGNITKKIRLGSICMLGTCGIKLRPKPAMTRKIG